MDSHEYERELKREKELQRKINSEERERVIGNLITAPLRAVGSVMKAVFFLVMLLVIFAIVASVIQYAVTGDATILEFLRGL